MLFRSITVILLLTAVAHHGTDAVEPAAYHRDFRQASVDTLVDDLVDRISDELFDHALQATAWPLHQTDLHDTTLGRPNQNSIPRARLSASSQSRLHFFNRPSSLSYSSPPEGRTIFFRHDVARGLPEQTLPRHPATARGDGYLRPRSGFLRSAVAASAGSMGPTTRDDLITAEKSKLQAMKASELKKELEACGIRTTSFFEKSEFVRALAEARVDGATAKPTPAPAPAPSARAPAPPSPPPEVEFVDAEVVDDSNPQPQRGRSAGSAGNPFNAGGGPFGPGATVNEPFGQPDWGSAARNFRNNPGGGDYRSNPIGALLALTLFCFVLPRFLAWFPLIILFILVLPNLLNLLPDKWNPLAKLREGMPWMGNLNPDMFRNAAQGGPAAAGAPFSGSPFAGAASPFAAGGNPVGGQADAMRQAQEMMQNPKVQKIIEKAQSNPKFMRVMAEVMSNPQAAEKYKNDPELQSLLRELREIY